MKKLFTGIIILLVVAMGIMPIAYAEDSTSKSAVLFKSNISAKDRIVSVKVSLGTIENMTENEIAGFQANIIYNKDILTYDKIQATSGWKASYGESTGIVLIESEDGTKLNANTQMAEIKFKIKDGVETLDSDIELKDIVLTLDEDEINITPDYETLNVKLTKKEEQPEEKKEEEEPEEKQPTPSTEPTDETSKAQDIIKKAEETQKKDETTVKATDDKTTAAKVLPKTGVYKTMAIITIIALLALVCGIRYKSIKIK